VTSHAHDQEPRTIGRRRLVRTGAAMAWTVPAIQVAAAAPALAVSGCCHLSLAGSARWRPKGLNYIDLPLDLTNDCGTPVSGLTVTLTICGIKDVTYASTEYLPAGWTQAGKPNKDVAPDAGGCYTLTFVSAQSLGGHTTTHPQFTAKSMAYDGTGNHRPAGTVSVVVATTGCTSPITQIVIPKVG
jgi:hypothetical protein